MTDFNITGTVLHVGSTQVISKKFQKRNLELETGEPEYPQINEIQFTQDRVSMLDEIVEGDVVKVGFYLKGREWIPTDGRQRRVFNELNGAFVEVISKATPVEHGQVYQSPSGPTMEVDEVQEKPRVAGAPADEIPF